MDLFKSLLPDLVATGRYATREAEPDDGSSTIKEFYMVHLCALPRHTCSAPEYVLIVAAGEQMFSALMMTLYRLCAVYPLTGTSRIEFR